MPYPVAIHHSNADSHEINVRPDVDREAGRGFYDPLTGRYVIPPRDIAAGELSSAPDTGIFRCRKQESTATFGAGDNLTFSTLGVVAGSDPLTVVEPSAAGERYVLAELNRPSAGGGGPAGPAEDYQHAQGSPATTWVINHNRGQFPESVSFLINNQPAETNWTNISPNQIEAYFSTPQAGVAIVEFRDL